MVRSIISFVIITTLLSSCGSDIQIRGCTDPIAENYESSADYDNGSCIYEVDIVFALDANSAAYLNEDDYATEVAYYIDNDITAIGVDYWNPGTGFPFAIPGVNEPFCYQPGYTSFSYSWIGSDNTIFSYEAIPDGGIFQWEGDVILEKQFDCVFIPLTLAKKMERHTHSAFNNKKIKE